MGILEGGSTLILGFLRFALQCSFSCLGLTPFRFWSVVFWFLVWGEQTQSQHPLGWGSWSLLFCSPGPRTVVGGRLGARKSQELSHRLETCTWRKVCLLTLWTQSAYLAPSTGWSRYWVFPDWPAFPTEQSGRNRLPSWNLEEEQQQHSHSELLSLKQTAGNMVMQSSSLLENVKKFKKHYKTLYNGFLLSHPSKLPFVWFYLGSLQIVRAFCS